MLLIDDSNYKDFCGDSKTLDKDHKHSGGCERKFGLRPKPKNYVNKFAAVPNFQLIPRSEWSKRIASRKQSKQSLKDLLDRYGVKCKDQEETNYCHANSAVLAVEICRVVQGNRYVELSAGSVGGPITNYQNEGAYIDQDLEQIRRFGAASTLFVPPNAIEKKLWKPGAEQDALDHRVTKWWDMMSKPEGKMFDRCATLLLQNIPVCVGYYWWGHAVTLIDLIEISFGKFGFLFRNSWGSSFGDNGYAVLAEGRGTPDEAYAPWQAIAVN